MKTIKTIMAATIITLTFAGVESVLAQDYTPKEKRQLVREMKKQQNDLYKKAPKMARKTAKRWEKEGWKSMNLPIAKQLEMTWERQAIMDPEGYPKYVAVVEQASGTNYTAAQSHAENVAKVRIASNLCSSVASLVDVALANNETTPEMAASISKVIENSKIIVSEKLGRVYPSTTVYKQERDGYHVRVIVLYDQRQAMKIAHEIILQELEQESIANKKQLEAIMNMDDLDDPCKNGVCYLPYFDEEL